MGRENWSFGIGEVGLQQIFSQIVASKGDVVDKRYEFIVGDHTIQLDLIRLIFEVEAHALKAESYDKVDDLEGRPKDVTVDLGMKHHPNRVSEHLFLLFFFEFYAFVPFF